MRSNRHTHTHRPNYSNPRCACAPRVMSSILPYFSIVRIRGKNIMRHGAMITGYIVHVKVWSTLTQSICGAHCPTCAETATGWALLDSFFKAQCYNQPYVQVLFLLISVSITNVESNVILVLMSPLCVRTHGDLHRVCAYDSLVFVGGEKSLVHTVFTCSSQMAWLCNIYRETKLGSHGDVTLRKLTLQPGGGQQYTWIKCVLYSTCSP